VGAVVSLIERSTLWLNRDVEALSKIDVANNVQQENLIWLSTIIALQKVTNVLKNFIEFSPPV
jgi:hypothetical protein